MKPTFWSVFEESCRSIAPRSEPSAVCWRKGTQTSTATREEDDQDRELHIEAIRRFILHDDHATFTKAREESDQDRSTMIPNRLTLSTATFTETREELDQDTETGAGVAIPRA